MGRVFQALLVISIAVLAEGRSLRGSASNLVIANPKRPANQPYLRGGRHQGRQLGLDDDVVTYPTPAPTEDDSGSSGNALWTILVILACCACCYSVFRRKTGSNDGTEYYQSHDGDGGSRWHARRADGIQMNGSPNKSGKYASRAAVEAAGHKW
jgi:hypothetical protein